MVAMPYINPIILLILTILLTSTTTYSFPIPLFIVSTIPLISSICLSHLISFFLILLIIFSLKLTQQLCVASMLVLTREAVMLITITTRVPIVIFSYFLLLITTKLI